MTLSTEVYVLDPIDPMEIFTFCQRLLSVWDEDHKPVTEMKWSKGTSYMGKGVVTVGNEMMQGLPAILDVTYREGNPLWTPEQAEECTEDCEAEGADDGSDFHSHRRAMYLMVDFDTAYGYDHGIEHFGCGGLHARLVAELGQWLDKRDVRWEWRNEYTGDVHGPGWGRYEALKDLNRSSKEALAWMSEVFEKIGFTHEH